MLARWEEFEQHEESMGQIQQQQEQYSDSEVVNDFVKPPPPPLSTNHETMPPAAAAQRLNHATVQRRPALHGSVLTPLSSYTPSSTGASVRHGQHRPPQQQSVGSGGQHWLKQMTNRAHVAISSVLGRQSVRRYDDTRPPGLCNSSQNVCFLNAVLQAMAHTPCLPDAITQLHRTSPHDLLMHRLTELVECLSAPVSTSVPLVLDSSSFRTQASTEFTGGLIQRPFGTPAQRQQDAAECLTWMLEWLHARMSASQRATAVGYKSLGILITHTHYLLALQCCIDLDSVYEPDAIVLRFLFIC